MSLISATELMRSAGLLVDGPARWGSPVGARESGVFIVELATPYPEAPIDFAAVRRWMERVPALTLDGEQPTPNQLLRRLAEFWLPAEQIVYVGRARRALSARVAALYATPLGDDRPNSGGHWLKTLSALASARLWWAATDAHEEYEDELLSQFKLRLTAGAATDRNLGLPFANIADTAGAAKAHGLADSLRERVTSAAADHPTADGTRPVRRSAPPAASSGRPTVRRRSAPAAKPMAPRPAPSFVSTAGANQLRAELEQLRTRVRPGVIERVKAARELGDLRENSEYESARREQSFVEGRIQALEGMLRTAVVVEGGDDGAIAVGSSVVVEVDGEEATWRVVGSNEADPGGGRISYQSPVGQALLGHRAGDEVTAQLPRGQLRLRVREVR